jgi:hypothetical protein
MTREPPGWAAVLAAAVGLTTAACALVGPSEAHTGSVAPPGPVAPPAVLTWTDTVCGALLPVVQELGDPPQFDVAIPAATRDGFAAYLAQARAATDRALEAVTTAGAAPVDGGEQVALGVRRDVTALRDELADARRQVEQVDVGDPEAVVRSVVEVGTVVDAVGSGAQALRTLDADPRLHAAFAQAGACARLRALPLPGR